MAKMGTPFKTCDRNNHKKSDKHGNYKAMLEEAYTSKETGLRKCSDSDYDRSRTKDNIALTDLEYVEDIEEFLEERAFSYRTKSKDGKEKKLRSDAKLCACGVLKVDYDYISELSPADRERMLRDAFEILQEETSKQFGFEIIAGVIHMDEMSEHVHFVGFDPDFQLSHKADIRYKNWLNFQFPQLLAERGWDIQPNDSHYDVDYAKTLDDEGLRKYREECIEEKKNRPKGLDSRQFKAMKDNQKLTRQNISLKNRNKSLQTENSRLEVKNDGLRLENDYLNSQIENAEICLSQKIEEYDYYDGLAEESRQLYEQDAEQRKADYKQKSADAAGQIAKAIKQRSKQPVKELPTRMKKATERGFEQLIEENQQNEVVFEI